MTKFRVFQDFQVGWEPWFNKHEMYRKLLKNQLQIADQLFFLILVIGLLALSLGPFQKIGKNDQYQVALQHNCLPGLLSYFK